LKDIHEIKTPVSKHDNYGYGNRTEIYEAQIHIYRTEYRHSYIDVDNNFKSNIIQYNYMCSCIGGDNLIHGQRFLAY
jgi:hypothetical protein